MKTTTFVGPYSVTQVVMTYNGWLVTRWYNAGGGTAVHSVEIEDSGHESNSPEDFARDGEKRS